MRIDFGTGHELAFVTFIFILAKLNFITPSDYESAIRQIFYKYMSFIRKVQTVYNLEPAGSHGVWGLDDYHFIPFLLGASELDGFKYQQGCCPNNPDLESLLSANEGKLQSPSIIHNDTILHSLEEEFMYFQCIKFIKDIKTGGKFFETSPILNDISGVPNWGKVATGLIKMFKVYFKFETYIYLYLYIVCNNNFIIYS